MDRSNTIRSMARESDAPGGSRPKGRLLLVDDDERVARSFARVLAAEGYDVDTRTDGRAAVEAVRAGDYDAVLSDIDMPNVDGLQLIQQLREHDTEVPVILVTGNPTLETAIAAVEHGALRYLPKPIELDRLRNAVGDAVRARRLARARREALEWVGPETPSRAERTRLTRCFDQALDSLWLAYQPIVSWSRHDVFGYEALMRSRADELPHPPAVIDAAERLGRLSQLGRTLRERAPVPLSQMPDGAMLFVNVHPRDLLDPELLESDRPLARCADRVVLELTERAALHDIHDLGVRVARLREMGFRLAIDDLGAGYAGLSSFAQIEPEVVKLDMGLIRNVHRQPTKLTLVRTMITMCRELGMQIVAEGIETAEERDAIVDAGCDLLQGHLFAMPGEAFPAVAW